MSTTKEKLALLGGPKAIQTDPGDIFEWPIITEEDEAACLECLRAGKMSGWDITTQFEREFADWHNMKYALGHNTGTAALQAAMWACGVGAGDEIICPSITYWASALPAFSLRATVNFADIDPDTLTIDPNDIEHRINERTKAIIVVHYCGYPCDMDPIMEIAERYGLKVIEDASHAHGGHYKGRLIGTIGHVTAMSCMSGKALPIGEGGMLMTNDQEIYQRAVAWGHYARHEEIKDNPQLAPFVGVPFGGVKHRMNQLSSAVGRVQLRHYAERLEQIQKAMNYFWDQLEDVPGIKAHRPPKDSGSDNGGWYAARGLYRPEELDGLPISRFIEALQAEGVGTSAGTNFPLHLHPVFTKLDIYDEGKPTRISTIPEGIRQPEGSLPVSESIHERTMSIPWFKHYRPEIIDEYAWAYRKVAQNAAALL